MKCLNAWWLAVVCGVSPVAVGADPSLAADGGVVEEAKDTGAASAPVASPPVPAQSEAKKEPRPRTLAELTDAELANLSLAELEALGLVSEIEVVGKTVDVQRVAGSAHVVGREQLEKFEYDDVHRVLAQVPGVYVRDEDGYGLRPNIGLRGASSDRSSKVTLMEDGVLLGPAPYSAPAAYYFPLVTRMVEMEVFKGPASIRFGPQTLGGAINMRTRGAPTSGGQGQLDLAGGLYWLGKGHLHYGYATERMGFVVEGAHVQSSGFKQLDGGGDTGFGKNEGMLKGFLKLPSSGTSEQRLELKLGLANEHSDETYLGLSDEDFQRNPLRRYVASGQDEMNWLRSQLQLGYALSTGYAFQLRAALYRHDFARVWRKVNGFRSGPALEDVLRNGNSGQTAGLAAVLRGELDSANADEALMLGSNDRKYVSQGAQVVANWRPVLGGISHVFEGGARLHYDRIDRFHTEDAYRMQGGALVAEGVPSLVTAHNRGSAMAGALYLMDEILLGDFLVVPGARVELVQTSWHDRQTGLRSQAFDPVFLPGLGAVYQPTSQWTLLAGVHQGFSPVSPGQADEVRPEQSVNFEAGTRYNGEVLKTEAVGFFNHYLNLVGECTFSTGCNESQLNQQFNGGQANVYGAELSVGAGTAGPFGTRLEGRLAYTLTLSEFLSSFDSDNPQFGRVEVGDSLPYVPTHQGAALLMLEGSKWSASLSASYVGAMREQAGQGTLLSGQASDPHLLLDAALSFRLTPGTQLYLTGDNLLNTRYVAARRPYGARPGKPLHAEFGLKHSF